MERNHKNPHLLISMRSQDRQQILRMDCSIFLTLKSLKITTKMVYKRQNFRKIAKIPGIVLGRVIFELVKTIKGKHHQVQFQNR